ncbi:MAG TPA: hypothetical protein VHO69_18555, partial [Phototrophicaceae bacterium]|nr:hypothetical protein [Phototrophicaceae bacterium]
GEIVLVLGGKTPEAQEKWDEVRVCSALMLRLKAGEPLSRAARAIAGMSGWERRDVYTLGTDDGQM